MPWNHLRPRVERLLGQRVEAFTPVVGGGYTPATRLLCTTGGGTFFVKAGSTPLTAEFVRREIDVYQALRGDFVPGLVGWEHHESEPILIIEDLSRHHWPPPWDEARIESVLAQIAAMHATTAAIEPFAGVHGAITPGWQTVAADPRPFLSLGMADAVWLDAALPELLEQEARCSTEGDCLTHCDLRSDNMCITGSRAIFVDWNQACLSDPKLDLGFWLPSLGFEGGPEPERALPDAPEVAAFVSGFFAARAGLPGIPDAPRVRRVQRQQLTTALPWAVRALDLPAMGADARAG